jgi:hypothetical protein
MKTTLNTYQIADSIKRDCNFSYEACKALAEYFESLEEDTGVEMEYDGVAIRCDWAEYESLDAYVQEMYPDNYSEWAEKDEDEQLEWVQNNHQVIEVSDASVLIGV